MLTLDAASGVAGLIKNCKKPLNEKCLPPSTHFQKPNPKTRFFNLAFYINTETTEWKGRSTLCGCKFIWNLATNAHVILIDRPRTRSRRDQSEDHGRLLPYQRAHSTALDAIASRLQLLRQRKHRPDWRDGFCQYNNGTLHVGRNRLLDSIGVAESVRESVAEAIAQCHLLIHLMLLPRNIKTIPASGFYVPGPRLTVSKYGPIALPQRRTHLSRLF